eukprot:m.108332 g.108332  ORF g.108332 m.108332 type:complete len:683 (+) comp9188_c0_seq1:3515-5563(+)
MYNDLRATTSLIVLPGPLTNLQLHVNDGILDGTRLRVPAMVDLAEDVRVSVHDEDGYIIQWSDDRYRVEMHLKELGMKLARPIENGFASFGKISFHTHTQGQLLIEMVKMGKKKVKKGNIKLNLEVEVTPDENFPTSIEVFDEEFKKVENFVVVAGVKKLILHIQACSETKPLVSSVLRSKQLELEVAINGKNSPLDDHTDFQKCLLVLPTKANIIPVDIKIIDRKSNAVVVRKQINVQIVAGIPNKVFFRREFSQAVEISQADTFVELTKGSLVFIQDEFGNMVNKVNGGCTVSFSISGNASSSLQLDKASLSGFENGEEVLDSLRVKKVGNEAVKAFDLCLQPTFDGGRVGKMQIIEISVTDTREKQAKMNDLLNKKTQLMKRMNTTQAIIEEKLRHRKDLGENEIMIKECKKKLGQEYQPLSLGSEIDSALDNVRRKITGFSKPAYGISKGPQSKDVLGRLGNLLVVSKGGKDASRYISYVLGEKLNALVCLTREAAQLFKDKNEVVVLPKKSFVETKVSHSPTDELSLAQCVKEDSKEVPRQFRHQLLFLVRVLLGNQYVVTSFQDYYRLREIKKVSKCFVRETGDVIDYAGFFGGSHRRLVPPFKALKCKLAYEEEDTSRWKEQERSLMKLKNLFLEQQQSLEKLGNDDISSLQQETHQLSIRLEKIVAEIDLEENV